MDNVSKNIKPTRFLSIDRLSVQAFFGSHKEGRFLLLINISKCKSMDNS